MIANLAPCLSSPAKHAQLDWTATIGYANSQALHRVTARARGGAWPLVQAHISPPMACVVSVGARPRKDRQRRGQGEELA